MVWYGGDQGTQWMYECVYVTSAHRANGMRWGDEGPAVTTGES